MNLFLWNPPNQCIFRSSSKPPAFHQHPPAAPHCPVSASLGHRGRSGVPARGGLRVPSGPCPAGPLAASRGRYSPREPPGAPGTAGSSPVGSSPALGVPVALPVPGGGSAASPRCSSALVGVFHQPSRRPLQTCPQISSGPVHSLHWRMLLAPVPAFPPREPRSSPIFCIGMAPRCGSMGIQGGCVRYAASPRCIGRAIDAHKYQHQLQV